MRASPFEKVFHRLPCVSYICTYPTVIVRTLYIFSLSFLLFFYFSPSAIPPLPLSLLFISRLYFSLFRVAGFPPIRQDGERERERERENFCRRWSYDRLLPRERFRTESSPFFLLFLFLFSFKHVAFLHRVIV